MELTRSPCDQLLSIVDYWQLDNYSEIQASIDGHLVPVEATELSVEYPLLPVAIRALIHRLSTHYTRNAQATGEDVVQTAYLLKHGCVSFIDVGHVSRNVTNVRGLQLVNKGSIVELTCTVVALDYAEHEGFKVPYGMRSDHRDVKVTSVELNARYPGWQQRWECGIELGLDIEHVMLMTFTKATDPLAAQALDTLTFE